MLKFQKRHTYKPERGDLNFWVTYADSKRVTGTLDVPVRVLLREGAKIRTYNIEVIDGVQMAVKGDHILYRADREVK